MHAERFAILLQKLSWTVQLQCITLRTNQNGDLWGDVLMDFDAENQDLHGWSERHNVLIMAAYCVSNNVREKAAAL